MKDEEYIDLDTERTILATCLYSEDAYNSVAGDIEPSDFALKAHQDIFKAMIACVNANEPISLSFIKKHSNKIDENALDEIKNTTLGSDIIAYANELKQKALRRQLLNFAVYLPTLIQNGESVEQIFDDIGKKIFELTSRAKSKDIKDMQSILEDLFNEFKKQKELKDKGILGLDTGFSDLNAMIKGFKGGDLIIVAARPGMGKTTICLNFIEKTLKADKGVVFFSLEMPATQILQRMLSAKTSIPLQRLMVADLTTDEWDRLNDACAEYEKRNLYIYDSGYASISDIRAVLRRLKSQDESISLCVVDYIGLMMGNSAFKDRHLQIAEISRGLKLLARELNIPIIALSQLNRSLESRANKRPMLSDLRESGAIEQDADSILFVYRDEVYREQEEKERENKAKAEGKEYKRLFFANPKEEKAELIVGKNRNGPTGTINLIFFKENSNFIQELKPSFEAMSFNEDMG